MGALLRAAAAIAALLVACRGGDGEFIFPTDGDADADADDVEDTGTDSGDGDADSSGEDADPEDSSPPEDADTPACSYPAGPYSFALNQVVAPMTWTTAIAGEAEPGIASLASLYCDPEVNSIFIQVTTLTCPACPDRMAQIAGWAETWETYGARWVFLVSDAGSATEANAYVERFGIDFGWRSTDADNSAGAYTVTGSSLFGGVPWTGVIDTEDMRLVYDEPDTAFLDIQSIARELATD